MDYLAIPLLAIFILIMLFTIPFLAAKGAQKEYGALSTKYKKKLIVSRRKLNWIKKHTEWDWPIWPRPILFEEIDHSTQKALGSAEHSSEHLEDKYRKIKNIEPLLSTKAIFDIYENIQRLITASHNKKQFRDIDEMCQIIDEADKTIRKNHKAIDTIKNEVRKKVDVSAEDLASSNNNIQFFQRLGSTRYNDAIKNIEVAQNCISYADLELANENHDDLVEWAAADLFRFAGFISLSIFSLKGRSYEFSDTFEADLVLNKLGEITSGLEVVIDYQNSHDWRQLVILRDYLTRAETVIAELDRSLEEFEANEQIFNSLLIQISNINIEELANNSLKAELELEEYIGTPDESDTWERILSRYQLPTVLLDEKKFQYSREIEPAIQGIIIKQSKLPQIIKLMNGFIKGIQKIQSSIKRIEGIAQFYIIREKEVKLLLSGNGEIERLVRRIEELADDTTYEIKQKCKLISKEFKSLVDLAFGERKKAQYPILLERIRNFKAECETLIFQHDDAIDNLQFTAISLYRELNQLQNTMVEFQYRKPIVEINWALIILEFDQVIRLYDERGNSFSAITNFIKKTKALIHEKKSILKDVSQRHDDYKATIDEIMGRISVAQKQIEKRIDEFRKDWIHPLSGYIQELKHYDDEYKQLASQLPVVQNDLKMTEAMNYCEIIRQKVDKLDDDQKAIIEQGIILKQELDRLKKHIDKLRANKKLVGNNISAVTEANIKILTAQNTDDHTIAKKYLDEARIILEHANLYSPNISIDKYINYGQSNIADEIHQINRGNPKSNQK